MPRAAVIDPNADPSAGNIINLIMADPASDKIDGFLIVALPEDKPLVGVGWTWTEADGFVDCRPNPNQIESF